jgi:hypothetical protein
VASIDIADYSKPFRDIRTVKPAARTDWEISSQRLDLANMLFAEPNGLGTKEIVPCGKQGMRCTAMLMPRDDRDGSITPTSACARPSFKSIIRLS